MIELLFELLETLRFQQFASIVGYFFGRVDVFTFLVAGTLQGAVYVFAYRRRLRRHPPARLVCPKRDADSQIDDYMREIWTLEEPTKLWYLARHNKHGNYISLIACNMDEIYSDKQETQGKIDFRPLASFEKIAAKIHQSGVGAADLRPIDCGPIWHRIFDSAGFARVWLIQVDLPQATGGRDHRGYMVYGWSRHQLQSAEPGQLQLITRGPDGPVLNLNSEIHNTIIKTGYRAAEILEHYHYNRPMTDRLREAVENYLIRGRFSRA